MGSGREGQPHELADKQFQPTWWQLPTISYCRPEVGPVEKLGTDGGERLRNALLDEQRLDVAESPPIDMSDGLGGLRVALRPRSHADFDPRTLSERMLQKGFEAAFAAIVLLYIGDDGFRRDAAPRGDHSCVKFTEVGEVPVEAASRNPKLARQNVGLEGVEAACRQRFQREGNPVSRC